MAQPLNGQIGSTSPVKQAPSPSTPPLSHSILQQLIAAQTPGAIKQIIDGLPPQQQHAALQALNAQRMAAHSVAKKQIIEQQAAIRRAQIAQAQPSPKPPAAVPTPSAPSANVNSAASTPVRTALSTNVSGSSTPTTARQPAFGAAPSATFLRAVGAVGAHEGAESRRRRDEGFRGTMRGEVARIMYAAGDVANPDLDSVDYMEDLVVEFLSDLCRPVGPLRPNSSAAHQAIPLSAEIVRHRLSSHSHLRKYLHRWDHMTYMSSELAASRRVTVPSHQDLIASVGKDFLGIEDEQAAAGDAAGGEKKKPGQPGERKKRVFKEGKERKKPGPKKGFKRDPTLRVKRGPYKRKGQQVQTSATASPMALS